MAFRWKNYGDRTPEDYGMVPPERGEQMAVGMQGYRPNSAFGAVDNSVPVSSAAAMAGYRPNDSLQGNPFNPPNGYARQASPELEGYGESLQEASRRAEEATRRDAILDKIGKLQGELDQITNKIAEIDKATPGLAKNPKEWEIAAKRAEIGDMSAYDNLVSRGNSDSSAASGIENELLNAEKLTWGLKSDDTETRRAARKQGEIAIIRAEEWAAKTGKDLPSSYFRLKNALAAPDEGPNANTIVGMLWSKMQDKSLNDADRAYAKALHDADPNSADAPKLREIYENTKGKTIESKEAYNKKVKASNALYDQAKDLPKKGLVKWWESLSEQDRKLFKLKHTIDLVKGVVQ